MIFINEQQYEDGYTDKIIGDYNFVVLKGSYIPAIGSTMMGILAGCLAWVKEIKERKEFIFEH